MTELGIYVNKTTATRNLQNENLANREKWLNKMQLAIEEAQIYLCKAQSVVEQLGRKFDLKDWYTIMQQLESEIPEVLCSKDILPYLNIGREIIKLRMVKNSALAWEKFEEFMYNTKKKIYRIESVISNQY